MGPLCGLRLGQNASPTLNNNNNNNIPPFRLFLCVDIATINFIIGFIYLQQNMNFQKNRLIKKIPAFRYRLKYSLNLR